MTPADALEAQRNAAAMCNAYMAGDLEAFARLWNDAHQGHVVQALCALPTTILQAVALEYPEVDPEATWRNLLTDLAARQGGNTDER